MDWIKIKPSHLLFQDFTPEQGYALVLAQCLTAVLERMPTEKELKKVVHYKTLIALQDTLKDQSKTLQDILNKVLKDVQGVVNDRERYHRYRQMKKGIEQEKPHNRTGAELVPHNVDKVDKEDKIREEGSARHLVEDQSGHGKTGTLPERLFDIWRTHNRTFAAANKNLWPKYQAEIEAALARGMPAAELERVILSLAGKGTLPWELKKEIDKGGKTDGKAKRLAETRELCKL